MSKKFWDEKFETMNESGMKAFQFEKLKGTVAWVYDKVPFYKNAFDEKGIKPSDLPNRDIIFEFDLVEDEKGMQAKALQVTHAYPSYRSRF